ncbi:MAG TPA: preprotein translocase subunit YajC [Actinomycetota bacterium]|nr:preprotein translocase subunit YajC [Actinomycetota bacterium]
MDPGSLLLLGLMIVAFYFVLIRPQQKRLKQHQSLVESLAPGDEVVTIGGLHGTVERLDEAIIWISISPGTTVKFSRQAVSRKVAPEVDTAVEAEAPAEEG